MEISVEFGKLANEAAPLQMKVGERVSLICKTASADIKLCHFVDPSGQQWGLRPGVTYQEGRISFPGQQVKNTCGITINSTQEKDNGIWR